MRSKRFADYIDLEKGTVDRRIYSDQEIYDLEIERIFLRGWNFMCHDSQIPKNGDFILNYIGEESVIAARDRNGSVGVFLNSCRHRGNAVCRAEFGNTRSFLCTYHGWTYGLDGKLIGVPGKTDLYHDQVEREQWGLVSAAKVESYKGFHFATMDPDAIPLEEFLGPTGKIGLDFVAGRGDMVYVEGIQKNVIDCNWKLAAENTFDWYHVDISHASAMLSGYIPIPAVKAGDELGQAVAAAFSPQTHRVVLGEYGHAISGPRMTPQLEAALKNNPNDDNIDENWRQKPEAHEQLGPVGIRARGHPNVFPNLFVTANGQLSLRLPKGPNRTEIWWITFIDRDMSPERQEARRLRAIHTFGPAGMLEQDDGENWEQGTRGTEGPIAQKHPFNMQMNLGRGEVIKSDGQAPYVDTHVSEHAQLWLYRAWADWMDAQDWGELQKSRTLVPDLV